jgi:3-hydroxyisobutyrate dehydrogenase
MTGQQAEKLGYLGLGMIGFPMAHRLLDAGYDVAVWNRSAGKAAALFEAGATLKADFLSLRPGTDPHIC